MFQESVGMAGGASGIGREHSTVASRAAFAAKARRPAPSRLDPSLSDQEQTRRHALAPIDKAGAMTKAQRDAWWFFRDLVQAASDKGVSRASLAADVGCDEGYLNGMLASGDRRAPSAGHLLALLMSSLVPEGAKRIVLEQMGVVAGVVSHAKIGGLRREEILPSDEAMKVGLETGELVKAIADAVHPKSEGGARITTGEAEVIRREAGDAAAQCGRAGAVLGSVMDVKG